MRSFGAAITTTCVYVFVALAGMAPAHAATGQQPVRRRYGRTVNPVDRHVTGSGFDHRGGRTRPPASWHSSDFGGEHTPVSCERAMTDDLTGLKNRRKLDNDVSQWIGGEARPTAMLMIDIDNFKMFNDMHGHAAGDDVLRRVGDAIAASVRCENVAYRYGGEEFCVLLPDATAHGAGGAAERVRRPIEAIEAPYGTKVTASVGVASGPSTHLPATAVDPRSGDVHTTSN